MSEQASRSRLRRAALAGSAWFVLGFAVTLAINGLGSWLFGLHVDGPFGMATIFGLIFGLSQAFIVLSPNSRLARRRRTAMQAKLIKRMRSPKDG